MKKNKNNRQIQLSFDKPTSKLVKTAIERIKFAYSEDDEEPLYCSTSKGKDSVVIEALCDLANVKFEKHIALTSVDPPELIQFAKKDKELIWDIPRWPDGTQKTMWNLIPKKRMPPTRLVRYCCSEVKECFGKGRKVITGVRWAESLNRLRNSDVVKVLDGSATKMLGEYSSNFQSTPKGGVIFNLDNDEKRRMLELCYRTHKTLINPIIDWEDDNVWDFIHSEGIAYCGEYDKGKTRMGCIGCPMNTAAAAAELEAYPTYKQSYILAFQRMIDAYEGGCAGNWKSGQDVMDWWLGRKPSAPEIAELELYEQSLYEMAEFNYA